MIVLRLKALYVWFKLFWPVAKELVEHGRDGVYTFDEIRHILDETQKQTGRNQIRLWGNKNADHA